MQNLLNKKWDSVRRLLERFTESASFTQQLGIKFNNTIGSYLNTFLLQFINKFAKHWSIDNNDDDCNSNGDDNNCNDNVVVKILIEVA